MYTALRSAVHEARPVTHEYSHECYSMHITVMTDYW
jgi:hypothetical protein